MDISNNTCSMGEDHSDGCVPEWVGWKGGLRLDVSGDYSLPPSPDGSLDTPSSHQNIPVDLHCQEEERIGEDSLQSKSAFITSSTKFDLQCEAEDPDLRSSAYVGGALERISKVCDDTSITSSLNEEEPVPTSGDILPYRRKEWGEGYLDRLQEHQRSCVAERPYRCRICGKEFFRTANLRTHQLIHSSDRPNKCPECDKGFLHKVDLWRHLRNVHTIEHLKTSRDGPLIDVPPKLRGQSSKGSAPSQVDPGEAEKEQTKPYLCPTCGKGFRTSSLLSKHKVIHRQDRPYKCPECGKAFVQLPRLKRHQKIHTGERPFHCEECGRAFMCLTSLHRHQRIHTGEKPYSCTYCSQDFTESGSLRRHERIHQMKAS